MALRLYYIFNIVVLSFANLGVIAECAQYRISSLLLRVFRHFSQDFIARKSKVLDKALKQLPIRVLSSVFHIELGLHNLLFELVREETLNLVSELLTVVQIVLITAKSVALG